MTVPRATIRLQFHAAYTLDDAVRDVDYFAALGISHIYASPLQRTRPGSTHGYDVVDHAMLNPEVGGEPALQRLVEKLRAQGMGLILDIVPNHMSTSSGNVWWQDVLEWGRASPYAHHFDITWSGSNPAAQDKIVAPFLGQTYDQALHALRLAFDPDEGCFQIHYFAHRFPVALSDYFDIVSAAQNLVSQTLCTATKAMQSAGPPSGGEHKRALAEIVKEPQALAHIKAALEAHGAATPEGLERLDALLQRQHYRLCFWQNAADEINWRRFFEVTDLIGVCVELPDVFDAVHRLPLRLYAEGWIDGVRVDHVDGLADPTSYCQRLRECLDAVHAQRPASAPHGPAYVVVEKILAADESLPPTWPLAGTTGYDFMNEAGALLHDERGEPALDQAWKATGPAHASFAEEVISARRQILRQHLRVEFSMAAQALLKLAHSSRSTHDVTEAALQRVLHAVLIYFPRYRTYIGTCSGIESDVGGCSADDEQILQQAVDQARGELHVRDHETLKWMAEALSGMLPAGTSSSEKNPGRNFLLSEAIRRFQQLTPPLAAKAVEDTAFYRYGRLLSRNEVGADPSCLSLSIAEFHRRCELRAATRPHSMLATATHDHKRGEDLRARLAVLSECAEEWQTTIRHWSFRYQSLCNDLPEGPAPDAADIYMLCQMIVGAWPPDLDHNDAAQMRAFAKRLSEWQIKAWREAKRRSDWYMPDQAYEKACHQFLLRLLDVNDEDKGDGESEGTSDKSSFGLLEPITHFVAQIERPGIINSLAQTLLRLTCPGVPDLYQGTEFWDFSLVDPDNRRPVDYGQRRLYLAQMPVEQSLDELYAHWRDGRVKQALIRKVLRLRAQYPDLFAQGRYTPLAVEGEQADHVLSFMRSHETEVAIVIVTHCAASLLYQDGKLHVPARQWSNTAVRLPAGLNVENLHEVLGARPVSVHKNTLALKTALATAPVLLAFGNCIGEW